ncbi:hypothetical protein SNE40_011819 [Patella caerulea]|uniref:Sulfotransferase domain-containing protein n=2 Tax=Patella caerulea TaxID=87958 RepID=A0AAN8JQ40_PATCE
MYSFPNKRCDQARSEKGRQSNDKAQNPEESLTIMKRGQRWRCLVPLSFFFGILFYCNQSLWETLSIGAKPINNVIAGSGFRKLLEENGKIIDKSHPIGAIKQFPKCVIIGVRKCGTRALLEFLDLHSGIQSTYHEVHFFDDDKNYNQGLEWYRKNMPYSFPGQITVEKTPRYFISHGVPYRIKRLNSDMKIIVSLRHPTIRVISDYTQIYYNKLMKNETPDRFETMALDPDTGELNMRYKALQISIYHHNFARWLKIFPKNQIHIVDGDNLIIDPVSEIRKIEKFLGLAHEITYDKLYFNTTRGFYCMRVNSTMERCLGASKGRRHPDIDPNLITKFNKFFRPHNERLFKMINRRFPWS